MVKGVAVSRKPAARVAKKKGMVKRTDKVGAAVAKTVANAGVYTGKRSDRGTGLKFSLETFQTVGSFTPGTRIKYKPNPKREGSKSFDRYNEYADAKTVGESLARGSKVEDLFWELERGYYQVIGGERSKAAEITAIGEKAYALAENRLAAKNGPRGLAFDLNDKTAGKQLQKEEAWRDDRLRRCEVLAEQLKLGPEKHIDIKDELGIPEDRDCRLQRRVADELARTKLLKADKANKKITYDDVDEVMDHWGFRQNIGRVNVMPEGQKWVYSDTVGVILKRCAGYGLTTVTERYPNFIRLLTRWLTENLPKGEGVDNFVCTAINLNANYAGRRHRDGNNEGPSIIRAFGKFTGGQLRYWANDKKVKGQKKNPVENLNIKDSKAHNIKKKTLVFDGNRAHEVEAFEGTRYSIVYFSASGFMKVKDKDVKTMKKLGFPYPNEAQMLALKKSVGVDM